MSYQPPPPEPPNGRAQLPPPLDPRAYQESSSAPVWPDGMSYPPAPPMPAPEKAPETPQGHDGGRLVLAVGLVLLVVAIAAASFAAILANNGRTENGRQAGQIRTLQGQVSKLSQQLNDAKQTEVSDQAKNVNEFKGIGQDLIPLVQFSEVQCSSDFNGPNGPTQYWFLCTDKKPASSTG